MDITLETKGYSMALKDMRQWISKLRMIKSPLADEVKSTFKEKLDKAAPENLKSILVGFRVMKKMC